jgi:hypothetical protein
MKDCVSVFVDRRKEHKQLINCKITDGWANKVMRKKEQQTYVDREKIQTEREYEETH